MEITAIINRKGGTCKTTTAINLASALHSLGKKVLLIDLDPQANLTYSLGISTQNGTIGDVLQAKHEINTICVNKEGIDILPSSSLLADIELGLINKIGREQLLKENLKKINGYDYILIDCPPSLSILTVNALNTAHNVIIPLQMEVLSLQGLLQILETVNEVKNVLNKKLKIKGIVASMYDTRRNLTGEILKEIKKNTKEKIFDTVIRGCVKVAEAPSFAKSVLSYAPQSSGSEDYMNLAKEYIKEEL